MKPQTFFADPAVDKLMSAFLALAAELHISKAQHRALLGALARRGIVSEDDIEAWQPSPEEIEASHPETARMVQALFQPLQPNR